MELNDVLKIALKSGASDIHLKAGLPPMFRVDGALVPLKDAERLSPEDTARLAAEMMTEDQRTHFETHHEVDLSYGMQGLGRFRANVFRQRSFIGIVLRVISYKIPPFEALHLPKVVEKLCQEERGLILVTGATGSGKSTTLAAMIEHINSSSSCHIITIEDPVEFMFRDKRSVINQREVGLDTKSFASALRAALRQDPDVILVGEMRDAETITTALAAAETGHLVLSTLHTTDAPETVNRIIGSFPPYEQDQVRRRLASTLKAVLSQRLISRSDARGRVPAVEVMVNTGRIRELVEDKERTRELRDTIVKGGSYGMQSFDQSLHRLMKEGMITLEEAIKNATNPDDFTLMVNGISNSDDWVSEAMNEGGTNSTAH